MPLLLICEADGEGVGQQHQVHKALGHVGDDGVLRRVRGGCKRGRGYKRGGVKDGSIREGGGEGGGEGGKGGGIGGV